MRALWCGAAVIFFSETVKRLPRLMSKRKASDVTTVSASLKKKKSTTRPATGKRKISTDDDKSAKRAATARPVEHTHTEKPTAAAEPTDAAEPPFAQPPPPPSAPVIGRPQHEKTIAVLLDQGADAALTFLRNSMKRYNANSFCSLVYAIRTLFYEKYGAPPEYAEALVALQAAVDSSGVTGEPVNSFLQRNYREQRAYAKSLCRASRVVSTDAKVCEVYQRVCTHIEHPALKNFNPTSEESKQLEVEVECALIHKSSAGRKVIRDGDACVQWCVKMFQCVNEGMSIPEDVVCVALLLTTGRRTSE